MYGSWDMERDGQNFLSFWTFYLHFYPPNNPKNQNLKKWKTAWSIITLQMCTINDNHMMYGSWDMECNRQNFLSFWTIFCPFTPLWTQKIKILKKWKKHLKILSFYKHKWQSYDVWFLRYGVQQTEFFVILDLLIKISKKKNEKNSWRYYHFTQVYHKWQSYGVWFLRYGAWRTEVFVILDHFLHF